MRIPCGARWSRHFNAGWGRRSLAAFAPTSGFRCNWRSNVPLRRSVVGCKRPMPAERSDRPGRALLVSKFLTEVSAGGSGRRRRAADRSDRRPRVSPRGQPALVDPKRSFGPTSVPMRIATPLSQGTSTPYSLPVSRRSQNILRLSILTPRRRSQESRCINE